MRFYTDQHAYYCGIDLHARSMYACVLDTEGEVRFHKNLPANAEGLLKAIEPFLPDIVVSVECIFTWYWLADLCRRVDIDFVLGHALYMKAIHGGKAKNDRIDALKIATLLRGGMMPMAYVYPPEMRATRDLLRRRLHFVRKRGELHSHIKNTHHQCNLPEPSGSLIARGNCEGVAESFQDAGVRKSIEADLKLAESYTHLIKDLELHLERSAKAHNSRAFYLLRSIPGVGKILAMTILYEVHDVARFPRVQDFASYARLVKCAKESAGKRKGTSGAKIGNAHLKWAFSEATVLFLRGNPDAQKKLKRLERKHGKGKALSILAHKLGRAAYYMLVRNKPFDQERFLAA